MNEALLLDNQLCFPLYAYSKELIKLYRPYLDPLDLTYTQYITMMVLWEKGEVNLKEIGERLYLDSGTLTPVIKKLEAKGFIRKERSQDDERSILLHLTEEGKALEEKAAHVPAAVGNCLKLDPEDAFALYTLLHKALHSLQKEGS